MNRTLCAVVLGAALAAAGAPAFARAPSAADRGSMDWLLRTLQADRVVDAKGPAVDPRLAKIEAYRTGDPSAPFEEWTPVADIVRDAKAPNTVRDRAVSALQERIRVEVSRKTDLRVIGKVRTDICRYLLGQILANDLDSRVLAKRIFDSMMPGSGVDWKADDSFQKRSKAHKDLEKKLK